MDTLVFFERDLTVRKKFTLYILHTYLCEYTVLVIHDSYVL